MKVRVFGVGGRMNNLSCGNAHDGGTLLTLIEFLRQNGSTACTLVGVLNPTTHLNGSFKIDDVSKLDELCAKADPPADWK